MYETISLSLSLSLSLSSLALQGERRRAGWENNK